MQTKEEKLIHHFYTAFQNMDADKMFSCYHRDIEFYDPVFEILRGEEVAAMWRMLLSRSQGLELSFGAVSGNEQGAKAFWEAKYVFGKTARKVHNKIDAHFEFKDGKIIKHQDSFDLWAWSRQALGLVGLFLGWSPIVKGKIRSQAQGNLQKYMNRQKNP